MQLPDSLLPTNGGSSRAAHDDDVYGNREDTGDKSQALPQTTLHHLPPAFMLGLSGYDHQSIARTRESRGVGPMHHDSDTAELKAWINSIEPQADPDQIFGSLTRDPQPDPRPADLRSKK